MSYRGWLAGAGALAVLVTGTHMYQNKLASDQALANVKQRSAATVATVRKPVALITLPAPAATRPSLTQPKVRSRARQDVSSLAHMDSDTKSQQDALFHALQAAAQSTTPPATPSTAPLAAPLTLAASKDSSADQTFALAALDPDKGSNPVSSSNLAAVAPDVQAPFSTPTIPGNGLIYVDHLVPSVPEPDSHSLILAGLGLLGLAARARRSRHLQQSAGETNTL